MGTGTSQGVPVIGCRCKVCTSNDPCDRRLRTAALIRAGEQHIAIDCGPDFRAQMLRAGVASLDAILLTHQHNDHIIGLDDVRPFNFSNGADMPVYCTETVGQELQQRFAYIFETQNRYPGAPQVKLNRIDKSGPFRVGALEITPVEALHGQMPVLGFRTGTFAYLTDVKEISAPERSKLHGLDTLVLSALHHKPHHSHLTLEQAVDLAKEIGARQSWFIHMSHHMGLHAEVDASLPPGMNLGYDGLSFSILL